VFATQRILQDPRGNRHTAKGKSCKGASARIAIQARTEQGEEHAEGRQRDAFHCRIPSKRLTLKRLTKGRLMGSSPNQQETWLGL
jgi:hypothetical protein